MLKTVVKKARSFFVKLQIPRRERVFGHLTYCCFPAKRSGAQDLIVSFAGFSSKNKAEYNYVSTLYGARANRLFLLDDIENPVNPGSYYLGRDGDWFLVDDIMKLISSVVQEKGIQRVIMVGSSKGGTAALYYGIRMHADYAIIGAPQYHIGKYLSSPKLRPILETIAGDASAESADKLNHLLKDVIMQEHRKKPVVYLHYSPKDHTYQGHLIDLINDLRANGFEIHEDSDYSYENHSDIALYFPGFLGKTVKHLLKG